MDVLYVCCKFVGAKIEIEGYSLAAIVIAVVSSFLHVLKYYLGSTARDSLYATYTVGGADISHSYIYDNYLMPAFGDRHAFGRSLCGNFVSMKVQSLAHGTADSTVGTDPAAGITVTMSLEDDRMEVGLSIPRVMTDMHM